jgi:hypothetical protein
MDFARQMKKLDLRFVERRKMSVQGRAGRVAYCIGKRTKKMHKTEENGMKGWHDLIQVGQVQGRCFSSDGITSVCIEGVSAPPDNQFTRWTCFGTDLRDDAPRTRI